MFFYQKLIDRSTLRQGFQIPVEFHHLLKAMPGGMPLHGETRNVKVVIDGVGYDAQLKNQGFDRSKYEGHADVIQIRYSEGSALVKRLREVFSSTWNYVEEHQELAREHQPQVHHPHSRGASGISCPKHHGSAKRLRRRLHHNVSQGRSEDGSKHDVGTRL